MTILIAGGIFALLVVVFVLTRAKTGNGSPSQLPAPVGPEGLGTFTNVANRMPVTPVQSSGRDPASDEVLLEHLHATGVLADDAFAQAKARLGDTGKGGFTVTMLALPAASNKIAAIKAVRGARLGMGLADAKNLVDALPQVLFHGLSASEAARVKSFLEGSGIPVALS